MENSHLSKLIDSFESLSEVLEAVAEDEKTDPRILEKLYIDGGSHFYGFLALNPSTPVDLLEGMLEFEEAEGRIHILINPSLPVSVIRKQIKIENEEYVLEMALNTLAKRLLQSGGGTAAELLGLYKKASQMDDYNKRTKKETISTLLKHPKFPENKI